MFQDGYKPRTLLPYLIIAVVAILAYLPVSCMFLSLKNDVLAIEYPIQYFISESLRNGEFPGWLNTWAMGFPLQSILSWGVYSTPSFIIGLLFGSSVYTLHVEFVFYIIASGCLMYKLLKSHFLTDRRLSLLFACCYMLSGFTVGSSQWLLYITGMAFIPLLIYCFLSLVKKPSVKYALLFAVSYYLFFTNVHIYLTVVTTYCFLIYLTVYFSRLLILSKKRQEHKQLVKYSAFTFLLTLLLCAAPAFYTIELVTCLDRSEPIKDSVFFQSNYLHPDGLSSLLFPLSSIKTSHSNTEGTVLNSYIGLLPLLLLPLSIAINLQQKNKKTFFLLAVALLFLLISFGHLTPLRNWLNILPGMANFRHPGVLRVFFNLALIFYLAASFRNFSFDTIFRENSSWRRWVAWPAGLLFFVTVIVLVVYGNNFSGIWKNSFYSSLKAITKNELVVISAIIQLFFLALLYITLKRKPYLFSLFVITELIVNTLICTPYFTVSTYSPAGVHKILQPVGGFPVQQTNPIDVPGIFTDTRNNNWYNTHVFRKQVSTQLSMPGPLVLKNVSLFLENNSLKNTLATRKLIFINDTIITGDSVRILEQHPGKVIAELSLSSSKEIILQQATFPGWSAYYNGKKLSLSNRNNVFVSAMAPEGRGTLVFKFEKRGVFFSAMVLHLFVLCVGLFYAIKTLRSSFLS